MSQESCREIRILRKKEVNERAKEIFNRITFIVSLMEFEKKLSFKFSPFNLGSEEGE